MKRYEPGFKSLEVANYLPPNPFPFFVFFESWRETKMCECSSEQFSELCHWCSLKSENKEGWWDETNEDSED